MSGYEMKKTIDGSLNFFWAESFGQLYPQLRALCAGGLIELLPSKGVSNREKKTYQITTTGREALYAWISQAPTNRPPRDELLLKMFFTTEGDPDAIKSHCSKARLEAVELLRRYQAIDAELGAMKEDRDKSRYWRMTLKLGISQTQNFILWCDEILTEFD